MSGAVFSTQPLPSTQPSPQGARRPPSPIHRRLREATAADHAAVEASLDLLGPDLTIERYLRVLQVFHGYHAPVERLLAQTASGALPFPLTCRTSLLERDLHALGVPPDQVAALPRCEDLPRLSSPEHAAGCSYTIEGAALGGRVIARALHARLGLTGDHGAAFFNGEGAGTAARWTLVLAWIDEVTAARGGDEIVAAAVDTFRTFGRWIHAQGALR